MSNFTISNRWLNAYGVKPTYSWFPEGYVENKLVFQVDLTDEDFEYMDTFFRENSMYDLQMYLKSCNNLSREYHNLYQKANEEKNQKEKLFTSLSILGGLFVIVILI